MTGYTREELIGKKITDLIPPEDFSRLDAIRERLLKGDTHLGEWRLRRKDGHYMPVEVSTKIFPDGRWHAIVRDIQDRKQAEAEREQLLAREQAAREAAEAANRSKDEFLAIISHELRSPLNAMLGYARLLRYGPPDVKKTEQAVEIIERHGRAQSQLISDLIDTASIISGKLRLDVEPVNLAAVIKEALQTIYPAAAAKDISIQADLESEAGLIIGDSVRLQQVIWNLLSNAVKFTSAGGRVEVRLERIDPHVRIIVSDTGKGISPEFLPYIFDRFRQADASSVRRYGGLGLGLALVKYLVELHGGTIEATSEGEDRGATFKVLLPSRAVSATPCDAKDSPAADSSFVEAAILAGLRVLVVDDDPNALELVKSALAQYGADVVTANSAVEAYELFTTRPSWELPNVIVADLGMPDEDGYSLLRRVRHWERERDLFVPAVALTAYGRAEDRVRALMAGFQTHVTKPVEPAELAIVIASLVRRQNGEEKTWIG
jgi:signal transduction histidine kinase/ActR/RegA family two-component response regulator